MAEHSNIPLISQSARGEAELGRASATIGGDAQIWSVARYQMLAEHISDVIVQVDMAGVLRYVSPACRAFGYEPEELIGRHSADLVHPDDLARFSANAAQLFAGQPANSSVDREVRYRRKDGAWIWLDGNPRAILDELGRPVGLLNVFRDVTERRRLKDIEAERNANVALFETAFHHAPIGMALVSLDGRFLRINAAFCDLLGYSAQKMLGLDFQTITHADDLSADLTLLEQLVSGDIPSYQMEKRYMRADGAFLLARLSVSMVTEADGRPKHFIAQVEDLTARRAAKLALAESEQRYRRLANNAPDMVSESTLDGVLTYVSPACQAVTGFTAEELVGRTAFSLMHPEDAEKVRAMCRTVLESKGAIAPWSIELRAQHKDGRALWLECKPTPAIDPDTGRFNALNDVVRDITQRKTLETELRRAQADAEAAAAVKGEFLANMSHEIRTPLTAILGFSTLLSERRVFDEIGRGHLDRVLTASQSLLSIVNDILDFSKLEAGRFDVTPRATRPVDFAHDALLMFTPQADAQGLALDFIAEGDLPDFVSLDPDRVRQILFNLIGNAIKFTREGSVRLRLRYEAAASRLHFAVEDTGSGISESDQAKLFQRFAQVDGSSTRQHGGTGLGLAICRGLSEAMGGEVRVRSIQGQGSVFSLYISAPEVEAPQSAGQAGAGHASLDGVRVLVVDDNPANRELARAVLEIAGAEVTLAVGGQDALRQAAVAPYDIILLDRRMPGMDGSETLRRIRAEPGPNESIPILAFSADVDLSELLGEGGFNDAVGKPIDAAVLIETISKWTQWNDAAFGPPSLEPSAPEAGMRDAAVV